MHRLKLLRPDLGLTRQPDVRGQSLECIVACTGTGGPPQQCFFQCGGNPQVIQAAVCAARAKLRYAASCLP